VEDDDAIVIESDNDEESAEDLFVGQRRTTKQPTSKAPARAKSPPKKRATTRTKAPAAKKQTTLNFSQTPSQRGPTQRAAASRAKKVIEEVSLRLSVKV